MKIVFTEDAWENCIYWQSRDRKTRKRINLLIKNILRGDEANGGLGKPELLKGETRRVRFPPYRSRAPARLQSGRQ